MAETGLSRKTQKKSQPEAWGSPSRRALKSFFSCRYHRREADDEDDKKKCKTIGCTGSLCHLKDTSSAMPMPEPTTEISKGRASISTCKAPLREINGEVSKSASSISSNSSVGGSFRVMHLRRLSGCYECHMVVDPVSGALMDSSLRATICTCPDCGEIFVKADSLEFHQSVRHAVSELGPEDTSRNIVEIIFQSSWLKKQAPACKIDRILKVHNTKKTLASFEEYRDSIKNKASRLARKHPRCAADGNELLRFHCTTFTCSLGLSGSTSLCGSIPRCRACSIVRDGMKADPLGRIQTLATSGRAHDTVPTLSDGEKRAMLVCRVIAGRVRRSHDSNEESDSVAGMSGMYSNLDELFVFNPKAILPCFVVIYRDF